MITRFGLLLTIAAMLLMTGCVSVEKVATGAQSMGERMSVQIEGPWNRVNLPNTVAQYWTMEGMPIDQLMIHSGIRHEGLLHAESSANTDGRVKSFRFRSNMTPDEIVSALEGTISRDGSSFTLIKLEPAVFGGVKGFRFEFQLLRKSNNLPLKGVGLGAVSKGELFSIVYLAPRMGFFDRHIANVEKIAASARIKE